MLGVSQLYPPKHVLELGSGLYSTPAFLNRNCFPTVETVHSVEDELPWFDNVKAKLGAAEGFSIECVDSVPEWVGTADLSAYDLIFIDDSHGASQRARSIAAALGRAAAGAIVVIHDFEERPYRNAVRAPWSKFTFSVSRPMTGVAWRQGDRLDDLKALRALIRRNAHIPSSDITAWSELFRTSLPRTTQRV